MYKIIPDVENILKKTRKIDKKQKEFILQNKEDIHDKLNRIRFENNILSKIIFEISYNFLNLFEENHKHVFLDKSVKLVDKILNYPFRRNKNNTLKLRYGFTPTQFFRQDPSDNLTNFIFYHFIDYILSSIRYSRISLVSDIAADNPLFYKNEEKTELNIEKTFSKLENIRHILGPLVFKLSTNVKEVNSLTNQFFNELYRKQSNGQEIFGYVIHGKLFPIGKKFQVGKLRGSSWLQKTNACITVKFLEDNSMETISLSNIVFIK